MCLVRGRDRVRLGLEGASRVRVRARVRVRVRGRGRPPPPRAAPISRLYLAYISPISHGGALPATRHEERRVGGLRAHERRQAHGGGLGLVPGVVSIVLLVTAEAGISGVPQPSQALCLLA